MIYGGAGTMEGQQTQGWPKTMETELARQKQSKTLQFFIIFHSPSLLPIASTLTSMTQWTFVVLSNYSSHKLQRCQFVTIIENWPVKMFQQIIHFISDNEIMPTTHSGPQDLPPRHVAKIPLNQVNPLNNPPHYLSPRDHATSIWLYQRSSSFPFQFVITTRPWLAKQAPPHSLFANTQPHLLHLILDNYPSCPVVTVSKRANEKGLHRIPIQLNGLNVR